MGKPKIDMKNPKHEIWCGCVDTWNMETWKHGMNLTDNLTKNE